MNTFLIISGVVLTAAALVYSLVQRNNLLKNLPVFIYSLICGFYLCLCPSLLDMLTEQFGFERAASYTYIQVFMCVLTVLPFIAAAMLIVFAFYKKPEVENIAFNVFAVASTAVGVTMAVTCALSYKEYLFLIAFIPIHWIMPIAIAAAATLDLSVKTRAAKAYIAYAVLAALCIFGAAEMIYTSSKTKVINASFFIIIIVVLAVAAVGPVCALISGKKNKDRKEIKV